MKGMCLAFQNVPLANKVEIFRHVLENTKGEDLQKVLWLKSPNSETWVERRTNYTRSLATMSMVGYILGLGDRHPSNLMLQRFTGKIVHIDFGDCFEVAMKRERYPERVPFRLTRMLVKALEACGIEGNYKNTCEIVMGVLRENRESLMAVLEAFVYDPLLNWRLLTPSAAANTINKENPAAGMNPALPTSANLHVDHKGNVVANPAAQATSVTKATMSVAGQKSFRNLIETVVKEVVRAASPKRKEDARERELQAAFADEAMHKPTEILNQKALEVVDRIKKKLVGRDFKENEALGVGQQVERLIKQATSHENICQVYIGWCPYW
eukprot:TRINITY_DN7905_c0_g4_i2.p2 TRINITY_DN7905_c0_g4~~TRINITY_DN7905_c0_g4_i2.p2  ORF type:complete len:326 (-),score=90.83 TRINITY_DN7905_c0_g4_i2:337-1314(-)